MQSRIFSTLTRQRTSLTMFKLSRQYPLLQRRFATQLVRLIDAVREENINAIALIAKNSPSVITQQTDDKEENTALHEAAKNGNVKMIKVLAENFPKHFDKNNVDDFLPDRTCHCIKKRTALHYAVEGGHVPAAEELLKMGAKPTIKDETGSTAFDYALEKRHDELICLLAKNGGKAKKLEKEAEYLVAKAHANIFTKKYLSEKTIPQHEYKQTQPSFEKFIETLVSRKP